ncbi:MAG: nuclear transport factor 2 family protein [Acidobacteria bacterium]|nr:nuclear transport factor 2 family protein [Acidobacteriota bacterium]
MSKRLFAFVLTAALALATACGEPATTNTTANKAANTAGNAAPKAADTAAVEAGVKKMIADFEAALNKNDADAVGKFYRDDYELIDQNGQIQTKASRVEQIKSGKIKWDGLKFSDLKAMIHPSGDGAVMTARANGKVTIDGRSEERNSYVTWVIVKDKDGWKFVKAQITDIKGGTPPASGEKPGANSAESDKAPADR